MSELIPIQVSPQEIVIPLAYFPHASELELVVKDDVVVVRVKTDIPRLHHNERRAEMLKQTAVFEAKEKEWFQHYPNQYVAVYEGKLVDHDTDHLHLVRRINAQYPGQVVLIRQLTTQPPAPLHLGSPRVVRSP